MEEYQMYVMLNYKLYERQMVDDDQLNTPMENNEGSMEEKIRKNLHEIEEIEAEFDGICGAVKSLTERVSVFYQKRHLSVKESLDKELESLPWAEFDLIERNILSGCSFDAHREAFVASFSGEQSGTHCSKGGGASEVT